MIKNSHFDFNSQTITDEHTITINTRRKRGKQ